ncbi:Cysteine synthase 2 [Savitreella phatthalungensis]
MTVSERLQGACLGAAAALLCIYLWQRSRPEKPTEEICDGVEALIGETPLLRIRSLSEALGCDILGKCEFVNPGQSPKDRVALSIIRSAEAAGRITAGSTIYEGTVGSTGISLAVLCRALGYKAHICMPDDQAVEKSALLEQLGATVERVRPASIVDKRQFVNLARSRAAGTDAGLFADQFENEANWRAHHDTTAPEIWRQTGGGRLDSVVAGAGTGGTLTGLAAYLKPRVSGLQVILADPQGSSLFNKVRHGVMFGEFDGEGSRTRAQVDTVVEGIGINRLTHNFARGYDAGLIDDAIRVTDAEAVAMSRWLVEHDGLFLGSSSAVNLVASCKVALVLKQIPKTVHRPRVVTILCDPGTRHLSKFHSPEYLAKAGLARSRMRIDEGGQLEFYTESTDREDLEELAAPGTTTITDQDGSTLC